MSKIKGKVIFDGAAAEPKGYVTDADVEFNSNEDGVLQSFRVGEKNYTIPQGSNDMFLTVYTTTTMNTSTLPSIQVPKLTADQIANIQTAMSQGKEVTIDASYNGVTNQFKVLESDHDGDVGGIRLVYYNYYLDYTNDDDSVVATYAQIGGSGGGGTQLYAHKFDLHPEMGDENILIVSTRSTSYSDKYDVYADYVQGKIVTMVYTIYGPGGDISTARYSMGSTKYLAFVWSYGTSEQYKEFEEIPLTATETVTEL